MAQLVKLKRTAVPGRIPTTSNLELGELAINTYDGRIFFEKSDGSLSIQEILTTNSSNSGSFNLIGAISASSYVSASYFIGDGSQLTFGGTGIVSSSSQLNNLGFAVTSSNTFTGAQTIQNTTIGGNYSLIVQGSTTGDRLGVLTNTTAGSGITITSRNSSNSGNTPLNFSGSSFEFGGGDVTFLNNVTIDGTLTINSAADVLIEENTLKLNYGTSFDSGGLEVSGTNGTGSLLWDDATSKWIAGTLGNEVPILLNSSQVTLADVTGFTSFSSSVDTRLDALETDTGSQDSRLDALEAETGSITTEQGVQDSRLSNIESFTSSLSTTEYTYSGSFSGSFVGDGSQLSGVTSYTDADTLAYINSQGVISGSDQVTQSLDSRYLEINGDNVVSSSAQISNYAVFAELNGDNLVSSSQQISNYNTFLEINGDSVVSSSAQISNYNTFLEINGDSVVSSSAQVISHLPSGTVSGSSQILDGSGILSSSNENFTTFSSSVDSRLDDIQTYTSSLKTAISVSGTNVTVLGNLDVQGTTTTVDSSTINISGSLLKLNYGGGAVDGGIEVTDATLSGLDTGSLIWDGTNNYWKGGVKGSEVKLLRAGGDGILSGSSQVAGSLPSGVISGSQQVIDSLPSGIISGSTYTTFSSSVDSRLDALETDTGSQDSRLDLLESYTSSQDNKNSTLATYTSSVDVSLSLLNTYTSSQDNINSGYNSFTSSYFTDSASFDSRLDQLETDTGSQDSRLDSLELFTSSLSTTEYTYSGSFSGSFVGDGSGLTGVVANGTVSGSDQLTGSLDLLYESQGRGILSSSNETFVEFSSSVDSRLDSLETDTGSQDSRLDSLEAATGSYITSVTTNAVVSALSNQTFDLGSADITANSFTGDGSNLTNITVAEAATVSQTFTNSSSITVTHNFNTRNVIVVVYDSGNNQIIPSNVNTTNLDQAIVTLSGTQSGTVVVAKGGHIISGNASSFGGNFSSNVSLNSYTLSGSGNIDFVGDLTVNGNTTITGTLTLSNADDIRIEDNILLLNWGKGTTDGGLQVSAQSGATGSIFWDESAGVWKGGTVGNELTFLRSGDVPSISALNTFTSSADNSITLLESISSSHESRLDTLEAATSSYQSLGAGVLSGSQQITNFGFISGSDLDSLNTYTQSNDTRIDGLDLFTSSFQTAITLDTTNVTILGNLTVQGTQTILDTTTLNVADKNLLIASGAANSAAADGAGITIDGAGATLLYKSTGDYFLFNKEVSGSFSGDFTGDGSSLSFNGTNIVSSSQQVIDFLPTGVVSGSDQTIANLPTGTVSGSTQITDGSGIVSSSQQVIDHLPTGTISGSQQVVDSLPTGTISGSGQLPSGIISGSTYTNFSSSIDARLDSVESYTGSLDITNAILTGSFTGSFVGDGSGLTGLTVDQVASITASFSNQSTINVAHNFNSYNVIASIYDSNYSQLIPQSVNLTDTNTLQVVLSGAHSGHVVVAKGGHVISSQDTYTETVSGNSTYSITHNLDSEYPFVQAWNTSTKKIEQPQDIESNSANEITVTFSGVFGGKVIVKK